VIFNLEKEQRIHTTGNYKKVIQGLHRNNLSISISTIIDFLLTFNSRLNRTFVFFVAVPGHYRFLGCLIAMKFWFM